MSLRLSRYHVVGAAIQDERPRNRVLGHAAYEWVRWQAVSPAHAEAWRDKLPPDAMLLGAILEREKEEIQRREARR